MATCEVCENEYDKAFEVVVGGKHHTFDSFECAIHALAPVCPHCNCRIIGHGVEADGQIFCCVHCARTALDVGCLGGRAIPNVRACLPLAAVLRPSWRLTWMRPDFSSVAK